MILIDANIILSYENTRDSNHNRAIEIMNQIVSKKYGEPLITDYIFNEVIGVTNRKFGHKRAVHIGSHILNSFMLVCIDPKQLSGSWEVFSSTRTPLNLVDCTNVIIAQSLKNKHIATFDKEFLKIRELNIIS